jgi:adenine-specific DNA-methyltransferase
MNLKGALLESLTTEQLREACAELEITADRRSNDAMLAALAKSRKAKPERLVQWLTVQQIRRILPYYGESTGGEKEQLVQRLLAAGGGSEGSPKAGDSTNAPHQSPVDSSIGRVSDGSGEYRHLAQAVLRPDAGLQDQFQAKKPPKAYRYDSSLDPALSWDEQRERDLGEWLLGLISGVAKNGEKAVFAEPQEWRGGGVRIRSLADAAQMLQQISKPFLNWAGKAERHEIRVPTAPLFVHERHSTKSILDGIRYRKARGHSLDLFGDTGLDIRENLEAYEHKGPWQNRMILGDSQAVMNSLLEFEGMAGQVQMIYIDPPYGVKFGSNFQPFVRKRDVKHGGDEDMTREPEMVKAYRDTWELGLHSYLTYLRDRLQVAKALLHETGSIFVQISDTNIHHVRDLLDECFGKDNFVSQISFQTTSGFETTTLATLGDFLLWYARDRSRVKVRKLFAEQPVVLGEGNAKWLLLADGTFRGVTADERRGTSRIPEGSKPYNPGDLQSQGASREPQPFEFQGKVFLPGANSHWKANYPAGMHRLAAANRIHTAANSIRYRRFASDFPYSEIGNIWTDTIAGNFTADKIYVVQTNAKVVERCIHLSTDPGDLVLDPTCGSGTTAYVAELWGRRWITIDTSRVPLALARQRLLTAIFPYFGLKSPRNGPAGGFVYNRKQNRKGEDIGGLVPHTTLKSIANDEPPTMEVLVDRPDEISDVTRVSGPFVVEATVAPVQPLESASAFEPEKSDAATHVERMTEVLRQSKTLRLPGNRELLLAGVRRTVGTEYLHAEAKEGGKRLAIVFGPADGAVSSTLVYEAGREAHYLKYDHLYFFGFAVEPNARAMIEDERKLRLPASYVAVTPDVSMSDLLKTTRASEIFSVTGLPDVTVRRSKRRGPEGQVLYEAELKGLDVFDPESLKTDSVNGNSVPCWMLDTDYDGLSFYASQVFFPKTSAWDNLQKSLKATFDESVWSHLAGTTSEPFALGERKRVAVKVIDERGNELMRVIEVTA